MAWIAHVRFNPAALYRLLVRLTLQVLGYAEGLVAVLRERTESALEAYALADAGGPAASEIMI